MASDDLSIGEARRIALAAQGFDRPRPGGRVGARHLDRTIRRLGLLQIDSVNVLVRAHYKVPFSRLGPYDRTLLDDVIYRRGGFTEQWAHEASIVPVEHWPLFRHRRETHRIRPYNYAAFVEERPDYCAWVLDEVRARGPLAAEDLPDRDDVERRAVDTWYGTIPRIVLEAHFGRGTLAVAGRRTDFSRFFNLSERLIPPEHHGRVVAPDDARRELLRLASRAHGVGTAADLADYYRMPVTQARPRLDELVEAGDLRRVRVEGWREPAYLDAGARVPRRIDAASLLSPFDPVVWYRPRVERLFDFEYRVEIFVPGPKRRWGYYVLPFLLGDRLVARADLKADRPRRRLLVLAAHLEPHAQPEPVAEALAAELEAWARWLDLDAIDVADRGDLARPLAALAPGS
jgi:uncharacterized protein YcaQ